MKINPRQRRNAKSIATGNTDQLSAPVSEKAQRFGLIARSAGTIVIDDLYADIAGSKSRTIGALTDVVRGKVAEKLTGAFGITDTETIDALYDRRYLQVGNIPDCHPTRRRMVAGLAVGMTFEGLTLNTIRYHALQTRVMTRAAVAATGRIPFTAAMAHGDDLALMNRMIRAADTDSDFDWVLDERYVRFDAQNGLVPEASIWPKQTKAEPVEYDDEQIGCPMTLVPKFLETIHAAAADAAISNGLIRIRE